MSSGVFLIILLGIIPFTVGFRILAIFSSGTKSHDIFASRLVKELDSRGHNLTVLTAHPDLFDGLETVYLEETNKVWLHFRKNIVDLRKKSSAMKTYYYLPEYGSLIARSALVSKEVQSLMKSNRTFDLILMEDYFNEALLGFSHIFQSPVVMVRLTRFQASNPLKIGSYDSPAVIPTAATKFTANMSFSERLENTLMSWFKLLVVTFKQMPSQERLYNEFFNDPKPPLRNLMTNVSIYIQNMHLSTSYIQPRSANCIDVGGLHIDPVRKELPKEIADFIDSSESDVIYLAFGGNAELSHFPKSHKESLIRALKKTNLTVLVKMKGFNMVKEDNILFNDWFPQNDILAHPKTKLFITHGGLQSLYEVVYHAVPIVGIPIFGDQHQNIAFAVEKDFGVLLEFEDITEESAFNAISRVLKDERFKNNVERFSRIHHDRQSSPIDTAVYWIEYVKRHDGALHLRTTGLEMGFIQYYSWDVVAFLILVIVLVIKIMFVLTSMIVKRFCGFKGLIKNKAE